MNLWAKRAGLLLSAAVLIFLISCEDDSFLLGFKGKTKFKGRYHEIVFDNTKSSMLLIDSVFTDQYEVSASPVNPFAYRFLIGSYVDPTFGTVNANFYAQFLPNAAPAPNQAYFNSDGENFGGFSLKATTVQLWLDFYAYGNSDLTIDDVINVYSLQKDHPDSLTFYERYINTSTLYYNPELIGQLTVKKYSNTFSESDKFRPYVLDKIHFDEQADRSAGTRDTIMFQGELQDEWAFRIFSWIGTKGDTALVSTEYLDQFRKEFPGLAFVSTKTSRIVGLNPLNAFSRLTFHYKTPTKDSVTTSLYFTPFPYVGSDGFTNITSPSGPVSGMTVPWQPSYPSGSPASTERYIQDGVGIITELDLSEYYSFIDTLEDIIINSAEISLAAETPPAGMPPPSSLYAMLMKKTTDNRIMPLEMDVDADSLKMRQYSQNIFTDLRSFAISNELSNQSALSLNYDASSGRYVGYATIFFQALFKNKHKEEFKVERIGLYPKEAPILKINSAQQGAVPLLKSGVGNQVNRVILKTSGMKLKIYYTVPNKPNL